MERELLFLILKFNSIQAADLNETVDLNWGFSLQTFIARENTTQNFNQFDIPQGNINCNRFFQFQYNFVYFVHIVCLNV